MAENADSVVVELVAKVDTFDRTVKQSATAFGQAMGSIASSAGKAEAANENLGRRSGNARIALLELGHVGRSTADELAAGAPLTQIFSQQLGRLGQVAGEAGGALGKVGAFLGGPWGIALTLATVVLTKLALSTDEEKNSVEALLAKMREHATTADNSRQADEAWKRTIEGVTEAIQKRREEQEKELRTPIQQEAADAAGAAAENKVAQGDLAELIIKLAEAKRQLKVAQANLIANAGNVGTSGAGSTALDSATIARLTTRIPEIQAAIDAARKKALPTAATNIRGAEIAQDERLVENATDKVTAATNAYTEALGRLRQERLKGQISRSQFRNELAAEAKRRDDAIEAARDADRKPKSDNSVIEGFKRSVVGAEGLGKNRLGSSAEGIGQFTKSTFLSYFDKLFPDKAALSEEAKLKFRDVRDVAGAVIDKATDDYVALLKKAGLGITAGNLYAEHLLGARDAAKLLKADANTPTSQLLSAQVLKGNPFLKGTAGSARAAIATRIGDSSGAVSTAAVAIQKAQDELKAKELAQDKTFVDAKGAIEARDLTAQKELTKATDDIAAIESKAIIAAQAKYDADLVADVNEGKLLQDQATSLKALNDEAVKHQLQVVELHKKALQDAIAADAAARTLDLGNSQRDNGIALLQAQEALVTTAKERGALERRIIDLQFAEEKARLEAAIVRAQIIQANKDQLFSEKQIQDAAADEAKARGQLGTLPARQAGAQANNAKQNAGPLQDYLQSIPQTADEINTAFENIAAGGLATFADALTNAIVHFRSLKDVARAVLESIVSGLIKLGIQQLILAVVGKGISAATTAATVAEMATIGAAAAGPAALVSLASFGANAIPATTALTTTAAIAAVIGAPKAAGGRILGPGTDTSDSILTPTSADEFVIKAKSARQIGYGALEQLNSTGRLPGYAGGGRIGSPSFVGPTNDFASRPGSNAGGFSSSDIQTLKGIVSDAARAMPDVALYASIDPAESLQRALATPAGSRAMLAHVGSNGTAYRSAIG